MWASGGKRAEHCGVADEDVEPAEALVDAAAELVDELAVAQVERHQRCLAAELADLVVDLLQPADGARGEDDMRALAGEAQGHCAPMPREAPVMRAILP